VAKRSKTLGAYIGYNKKEVEEKRFNEKILKVKQKFTIWKQRDL
jgi:hypothetical protein